MRSNYLPLRISPLTSVNIQTYVDIGIRSYQEHYLHLWEKEDASPYLDNNYTVEIVGRELEDSNSEHYLVHYGTEAAGIFKLIRDAGTASYSPGEALLVEKLYILKAYSGKGIGKACLANIMDRSRKLGKKIIWLDTMKKGPALSFYLKVGFEIIGEKELQYAKVVEEQKQMLILQYPL